jgi:hypothetical protein
VNVHAAWRLAVARRAAQVYARNEKLAALTAAGTLVSALVARSMTPQVLTGWAAREALVSRGDDLAVQDLLARAGQVVVRVVLALNRVYVPHRQLKWQRHLITGLEVAPRRLGSGSR